MPLGGFRPFSRPLRHSLEAIGKVTCHIYLAKFLYSKQYKTTIECTKRTSTSTYPREFVHFCSYLYLCIKIIQFRISQIYGGIAEGHPMSKFMWGNSKSLSPEGMDDATMHKR